jgi:hypothetical protein
MLGRPLQRTLTATPQKVYEAALALAQQRYMVRDNNQDKMNFKFDISPSLNDEGFVGDVLVEPGVDGQANMTVTIWCKTDRGQNVSACYLGNKRAEKFAKAVEERLAK